MPGAESAAAGAATGGISTAVEAGLGAISAITGGIKEIRANNRLKQMRKRRIGYSTPQEFFDKKAAIENAASIGFDPATMSFYEGQTNRALTSSLGVITRGGGDQNAVGDIFDRAMESSREFSSKGALFQYQKFSAYTDVLQQAANEKTAVWADQQAMLKDDMAAEAQKAAAGNKTKQSGLNQISSAAANYDMMNLYKTPTLTASPTTGNVPLETIQAQPSYMQNGQSTFGSTVTPRQRIDGLDYYGMTGPQIPNWYK